MRALRRFALALSLAPAALLAQGSDGTVWNEMTPEKLQALTASANPANGERAFEVCVGCHRPGAVGRVSGVYPRLAGQHATVLIKQMTDIRAGLRKNPKMEPFSGEHVISAQDIADIAVYLNRLPVPHDNGQGPGTNQARGKELYGRDCAGCHGASGEGDATQFYPKVAGQHFKYLLRESQMIAAGERGNANPEMLRVIKPYQAADLEAIADYMARLPF